MNYRYILHELAQQDYDAAVEWYAERSLIYTVEEDKQVVIISAIFHTGRHPKKKYRKI